MKHTTKAVKATKKASAKAPKTLGQVAYDSSPDDGGKSNFGPWEQAPQVVRTVHERMAKAVEREVRKRIKSKEPDGLTITLDGNPKTNPQNEWLPFIRDTLLHMKRDQIQAALANKGLPSRRRSKRDEADRLASALIDELRTIRISFGF